MKVHDEQYKERLILFLREQGPVPNSGLIASENWYRQKEQEFQRKLRQDGELE